MALPKLLLVGEFESLNGGERSMLATIPFLQRHWQLSAAIPQAGSFADALQKIGVEVVELQFHDTAGSRRSLDEIRTSLGDIIKRVSPSLIHAISLSTSRIAGPVAIHCRVPSVGHLRDIIKLSKRVVSDLNLNRRLIAVSKATADFHLAQGLDAARTHVLWNGVDLRRFRPRPATGSLHRELGIDSNSRLVLSIGQIGMRKGLDNFLTATEIICPKLPDVHFVIAGKRFSQKSEAIEYEVELNRRAQKGVLKGRVHFLGVRQDVEDLLAESTVLLHTAKQEPLGRVLLEAAAAGLPVVATRVGGTQEIFPTGSQTALITAPDDPSSIAADLQKLLDNKALRSKLSQNARSRMETHFSAELSATQLLQHYDAAL